MKRLILLGALLALSPSATSFAEQNGDMRDNETQSVVLPRKTLEVNVRIEPLSDEQKKAGLTEEALKQAIAQKLDEAHITMNETLMQPILTLRVRTIQSGLDYATFFQLSLQEESMLVRNRSTFNAITWSQASLLSCRPEDLSKEVLETVDAMAQSFAKDFVRALQPASPQ